MVEHLHAEGEQVDDPLPFWVGRRPQFEVLDPIVQSIPISMMDYFVRQKRSPKMNSHDESMFPDPCDACG